MPSITEILIYGLSIWRVASLFVREDGPALLFRKIREKTGITHDESGGLVIVPDTLLAGLLSCVWCASIWVSFFWTSFWLISPEWSLKFAVVFAFSAVAILIDVGIERTRAG